MTEGEALIVQDQIKCLSGLDEDELTQWEVNFIEDVSHLDVWKLSEKQKDLIERFYTKYC